ncbi:MAG: hypothetical protein Q9160_007992 [Pyrenula sp. 1 TL-2023]
MYSFFAFTAFCGNWAFVQTCQDRLDDIEYFNATGTVLWSDSKFLALDTVAPVHFDFDRAFILDTDTATNLTYGLGRNLTYSINVNQDPSDGNTTWTTTLAVGTPPTIDFHTDSNWEGLSVCALILDQLPINTLERGQNDDGSCTQMFSPTCVDAYSQKMAQYALWSTSNPQTTGNDDSVTNLTNTSVEEVCGKIASDVGVLPLSSSQGASLIPDECVSYFEGGAKHDGPTVSAVALTRNITNGTGGCDLQQWPAVLPNYTINSISRIFHNHGSTSEANYDNATRSIYPIITLFFPQVHQSPNGSWIEASAHMTCPRVTRFANTSRVSPTLAAPTPVHFPRHLSDGTQAGIGVGVACGIVLVLTAATVYYRRRRARLRTGAAASKPQKRNNGGTLEVQMGEPERVELDGTIVRQVGGRMMLEAGGHAVREAPGDNMAQEAPGDNMVKNVEGRRRKRGVVSKGGEDRAIEEVQRSRDANVVKPAELQG